MKATLISSILGILLLTPAALPATDQLEDELQESGWIRILGTWVDEETDGETMSVTYAWRFQGTLIEETSRIGDRETVSLIGLNKASGEVFSLSADNEGTSSIGSFKRNADGSTTLGLLFTSADGVQGALEIRFELKGDDRLVITVEGVEPTIFRLKRAENENQAEPKVDPNA